MRKLNKKSVADETEEIACPRELSDPRSVTYAKKTVSALRLYSEMLDHDRELVAKEIAEIERHRHWEVLGYESLQQLIEAELNDIGQRNAKSVLKSAGKLNDRMIGVEGGKPGPGRGNKTGAASTRLLRGETNAPYLAARIKRDHPEIAERIQAGEFRSIQAAAIAAGIAKPTIRIRPTVEGFTKAIKKRLTPEQIRELVQNLSGA